jgi:butyryl-CoA dehydrogenase
MDFSLTEEQKMLQTMAREFAEKEIEPIAAQMDQEGKFPAELIGKMADIGFIGLHFPEKYGGGGCGKLDEIIVAEEIARVSLAAATILAGTSGLAGWPAYKFSNEEQKQRLIVPIIKGAKLACFALTEPGAGSDVSGLVTTATKVNGGYKLNGTKVFITSGAEANIALVFATIDKKLKHRGITAFLVETSTKGFSVGKLEHKLGIRATSTAELVFEDCFVPEENRIGAEGDGFKIAMEAVDSSRVAVASFGVGVAQGAFDKALAYAKDRQQFGQPIANFQAIQWFLADMATYIDAARLLTYRAAQLQNQGLPYVKEASMAKVYAAETANFVASKALQIHGGYGYVSEYPVERYFRDARILEIYEGTSEMQRMTIARQLIKES